MRRIMGTWDHGLLDNDCASDGLFELCDSVVADLLRFAAAKPTLAATAKLGAAVGVLLQLSEAPFRDATGDPVAAAVQAHASGITRFAPPFRRILAEVGAGRGQALAARPARMPAAQIALLHVGSARAPFGKREPALFADGPAVTYVQQVARRCVRMVDEDFAETDLWSDLCREGAGLGGLAALLVLAPVEVPPRKIEGWRRKARAGLAELETAEDEELSFQRQYYANLDRIFAALLRRYTPRA